MKGESFLYSLILARILSQRSVQYHRGVDLAMLQGHVLRIPEEVVLLFTDLDGATTELYRKICQPLHRQKNPMSVAHRIRPEIKHPKRPVRT